MSALSHDDLRDAFDRALASPRGIKILTESRSAMLHLKHRLYKFRNTDRKVSKDLYPPGDPRFGTSIYDALAIQQDETTLIVKRGEGGLKIEEIEG